MTHTHEAVMGFSIPFFRNKSRAKVFGVGTLKTGTTSLGSALEMLGFRHTHDNRERLLKQIQAGNLESVFHWVDRHESFEDWPWPLIYRELDARYPDSRFILTTRANEDVWLKSMVRHAEKFGPTQGRRLFFGYKMPHKHEADYVARYRQHNQEVRDYFKGRPGKLLEVCWEKGHGWRELCSFLNMAAPDAPFPKVNTAVDRLNK